MTRLTPPKSPVVSKKKQSSCMYGLYSLFAFRQGRSDKKLLSYGKGLKNHAVGKSYRTPCTLLISTNAVMLCIWMPLVAMLTKKKKSKDF